jgi:DtxR family Mn-dependent transcriptional regulator
MPTSSVHEDYLKAVFRLGRGARRVLTSEIADALGVSGPSVTAMIQRLSREEMLDYSPRKGVRLTEKGRARTLHVIRRHRLLETFLVEVLGLDWSEVHAEAEVLEHHLSERMVAAIDRVLGHPSEDPHGHPIPDADGNLRTRDLTPMAALVPGERGTVRELRAREAGRLQRWKELGLVPGASCLMGERQELEDVMHISVDDRTIVTGSAGVDGVFVERSR